MKLVRLEIRNYRSIKEQVEDDTIVFDGLDCLVGKNNAGKSNILEAISFLLGEERLSDELYYKRDTSLVIDVRGYFEIEQFDFDRLKIESKRNNFENYQFEDGTIGVCQRSNRKQLEMMALYPTETRLGNEEFTRFHKNTWDDKESKTDFGDRMLEKYPELEEFLTEGKETNKGEWPKAYERFLRERPEGIEFARRPGPVPTGIDADLKNLLPEVIFIPAVKEVSEATKTTSRAEFGELLGQLSGEIEDELDDAIDQAMAEVYKRLNIVVDSETGEVSDERHRGVKVIEEQISQYLAETFQDISVLLQFPNPESRVMFRNARVLIRETGFGENPVDCVGEGVKRVLIFSLIRTLADLRQGKLSITEEEDDEDDEQDSSKPLLILYEEAELFLHPGLQRILLKAFGELVEAGDQVIFTTHSPFLLVEDLSTINLVNKDSENGTRVTSFHTALEERGRREKNRLLQVQNVSSYIFADKVLLVEGPSDRIVIKKIASVLNSEWNFEKQGIPILSVTGKGDLCLYREFLSDLGIEAFILTDIDAIEDTILDLCEGAAREQIREVRDALFDYVRKLAKTEGFNPRINKKYANKLVNGYRWSEVFDDLEVLYKVLTEDGGGQPSERQLGSLEKLLLKRIENAETKALQSDEEDVVKMRTQIIRLLLDQRVLLLSGTIENYYPGGSKSNKIGSALKFEPLEVGVEDIRSYFTYIDDIDSSDVEVFLSRLFEV